MSVSAFIIQAGETAAVVRDSQVDSVGMLAERRARMLVFLESATFLEAYRANPGIACVITTPALAGQVAPEHGLIISDNPRRVFYKVHNFLALYTDFYGQDFPNDISPEAQIHPSVIIPEKNVRIGRGTIIEPGVIIHQRVIIGGDCILRSGCIIGSAGFEFKRLDGGMLRVEHAGGAWLADRVEVQNNSNVNRSVFGGFTRIGDDTKIDTLVHIGHGAQIGQRVLIAACSVITNCIIGNDVWIGPGSTLKPLLTIGAGAAISIGSVVTQDVPPGQRVTGNFALPHERFLEFIKSIR